MVIDLPVAPSPSPAVYGRRRARIRGAVQGVGFRPHVWKLATERALSGWVLNDGEGVLLEIEGPDADGFLDALRAGPPPLARIDAIDIEPLAPSGDAPGAFRILESGAGPIATMIPPDAAVCDDCLKEMLDPDDRRHLYPFLNCTHCGPRYTLTAQLPYDRANTSMAAFEMCADCAAEYADPADRRYHAQPTACPACGPRLSHSLDEIMSCLGAGGVVALKGIGGFHLACDARDEDAVARLRARKSREAKPFAVMVLNLPSARRLAEISDAAARLLSDTARPVVLSPLKDEGALATNIAPGLGEIGLMLPYAPLHYLLFHHAAGSPNGADWLGDEQPLALVMTSANPGGEPLVTRNAEAAERLDGIADLIVTHDRDILIRTDDSVMRVIDGAPAFIRRARGHAPEPIALPRELPPVLALGAHLKSTICITRGKEAFLSQHIGDLDNAAAFDFLQETAAHLLNLLDVEPVAVACDRHPDFLSTRMAENLNSPLIRVQHHHAHIAAIAAEYGADGPLLGLALDGYGYGEAGEAWGGELILHTGREFERVGHLRALPTPGGELAARQPWRMAAGALALLGRTDDIAARFADQPLAPALADLLANGETPRTTSCGRLFDAAAGLLGVSTIARYEAESAMRLEAMVRKPRALDEGWRIADGELDFTPLLARLAALDPADPARRREGAELFHGALVEGLAEWAAEAAARRGLRRIALAGGCLLNRVLAEGLIKNLKARGLVPLYPRRCPPGDGAVSLGQAFIAGCAAIEEITPCV